MVGIAGAAPRQIARVHAVPGAQLAPEGRASLGRNDDGSHSVERYVPSARGATGTGMLAFQLATALVKGRPFAQEQSMNVVRLSAMLLVAGTLPALGQIHYTPSVQRYRLHSTVERAQEQNGQKTSGTITNEQQVTVDAEVAEREDDAHRTRTRSTSRSRSIR